MYFATCQGCSHQTVSVAGLLGGMGNTLSALASHHALNDRSKPSLQRPSAYVECRLTWSYSRLWDALHCAPQDTLATM